jgi:hypothetical protein
MIDKCKIGKYLEETDCPEFGILSGIYLVGLRKHYVIPHSG